MPVRLHGFDLGVVGLYLIGITLFGLRFARRGAAKDRSLRGYFLADKTVPWWAIGLSIVSAETSTLTIIGTPALAFTGDFGFLQIVIGYMLGRIVVAAIFLPKYFQGEMLTAYQLIDRRFGRALYKVTAGLFLLTRAAAEGVRVFAVSIVVGIAIGTRDVLSIAIITALTLLIPSRAEWPRSSGPTLSKWPFTLAGPWSPSGRWASMCRAAGRRFMRSRAQQASSTCFTSRWT